VNSIKGVLPASAGRASSPPQFSARRARTILNDRAALHARFHLARQLHLQTAHTPSKDWRHTLSRVAVQSQWHSCLYITLIMASQICCFGGAGIDSAAEFLMSEYFLRRPQLHNSTAVYRHPVQNSCSRFDDAEPIRSVPLQGLNTMALTYR
jgi:hypothetical protein